MATTTTTTEEEEVTSTAPAHLMYLPKDQWSPRYEETFYSVKLEGYQLLLEAQSHDTPLPPGKLSFPAYYYQVVVYRGHDKKTVLRRYSQFKWLQHQLLAHPPPPPLNNENSTSNTTSEPLPSLPPGTCPWQRQDDGFAACRMDELADFLAQLLGQPGIANHQAVISFLEL